ncbi:MAG: hypothetical protein E4H46_02670 [Desulfobacterales bacterium]|nr:MAG: hypothetical protein E4H46_02670 [Desulfobacterales bacterium]
MLIFLVFVFLSTGGCKKADKNQQAESIEKIYGVAILVVSDTYLPLSAEGRKEGMLALGYRQGEILSILFTMPKGTPPNSSPWQGKL